MSCNKLIICGCCKELGGDGTDDSMDDTEDVLLLNVLKHTIGSVSLWDALESPDIQRILKAAEDDSDMFPLQAQIDNKLHNSNNDNVNKQQK